MSTLLSSIFQSREPVVMDDDQIEAAHAATDIGHDDMEGAGVIVTPVAILALVAVISLIVSVWP